MPRLAFARFSFVERSYKRGRSFLSKNERKVKRVRMRFKTQQDQQEKYIVTRPKLRELLERQGYTCTEVKHPYSEYLRAWAFPLSRELAIFVTEYYTEMGRDVPLPIRDYLRALEW